jgi:hypothetical protein
MGSALDSLRRWKWRLASIAAGEPAPRVDDVELAFHAMAEIVEEGLRDIDFDEVTSEDRITFVEAAVAWQVRQALVCGRFDLALRLQRYGAERVAQLYERVHGWRPTLLYGVPSPTRREADGR